MSERLVNGYEVVISASDVILHTLCHNITYSDIFCVGREGAIGEWA